MESKIIFKMPNLSLSKRILVGYLFMILCATAGALFCIRILANNRATDRQIQNSYLPLYLLLKDMSALVKNSQMRSSDWVYQPNIGAKHELSVIQEHEFPDLGNRIDEIVGQLGDADHESSIKHVIINFNNLFSKDVWIRSCQDFEFPRC